VTSGYAKDIIFTQHSKFNVSISNICGGVVNVRSAEYQYAERHVEEHRLQAADFLHELLLILIAKIFMHLLTISAQIRQFALTCNSA